MGTVRFIIIFSILVKRVISYKIIGTISQASSRAEKHRFCVKEVIPAWWCLYKVLITNKLQQQCKPVKLCSNIIENEIQYFSCNFKMMFIMVANQSYCLMCNIYLTHVCTSYIVYYKGMITEPFYTWHVIACPWLLYFFTSDHAINLLSII